MNVMLAGGGCPWTVIPFETRNDYMATLEEASVRKNIEPFTRFLYVKDLIRCFEENSDDQVRSMCAWALGRIGDRQSRTALEGFLPGSTGVLEDEIRYALGLL
jgi:hypothetical protein